MKHAIKLPVSLESRINFSSSAPLLGEHMILPGRKFAGASRRGMTRQEAKTVLRLIPTPLLKNCYGISKTAIQCLPPHVHTNEQCIINFYVKTNKEETVFYEGDVQPIHDVALDSGVDYFLADPTKLRPVQTFVATAGEVWVLNTRQPHAVLDRGAGQEATREVVQAFFDTPIELVAKEFGCVL